MFITGCDNIKIQPEKGPSMTEKFLTALKEAGIEVEEEPIGGEIIGAETGFKFTINGEVIDVYEYDLTSDNEKTVQFLSEIRANGKINPFGYEVAVLLNKSLALANYENHSMKDRIIEIFGSVK